MNNDKRLRKPPAPTCAPDADWHEYEPPEGSHEGSEDEDDY